MKIDTEGRPWNFSRSEKRKVRLARVKKMLEDGVEVAFIAERLGVTRRAVEKYREAIRRG